MTETFADGAGRYRLDSRIATGGMGEVWRATDTSLGREVAVKLLKAEYADDPTFRQRFETEARHAAALHHPGIAAVYDVGEKPSSDGSNHPVPFLVMELVDGKPLSELIATEAQGRDLDPEAVADLLAQVGDALGAAHRAGIVHRDVKPANLIVTPAGRVKVTDFGIARAADGVGITRTGAVMGTPQYLSPEQAEGRPATAASDVYALGVVGYECLTGRRPFDAESPVATALAHIREPVPTLPDRVPAALAAVVTRSLAKDPGDRYADGAAFAAAVRDPSTQRTTVAPAPVPVPVPPVDESRTQVLGAVPVDPDPTPTPVPPVAPVDQPAARKNPWPVVLAVVLLVALAVVVALLVTGGDDDEPDDAATTASQTTTTPPPSSEPTTEEPETVRVVEADFVGQDIDDVESELESMDLQVERNGEPNDDPDRNGRVIGLTPFGEVAIGTTIRVTFYEDAPEETEEPTTDPPSSEPTSEEPTSEPPSSEPTSETPTSTAPTEGETTQ